MCLTAKMIMAGWPWKKKNVAPNPVSTWSKFSRKQRSKFDLTLPEHQGATKQQRKLRKGSPLEYPTFYQEEKKGNRFKDDWICHCTFYPTTLRLSIIRPACLEQIIYIGFVLNHKQTKFWVAARKAPMGYQISKSFYPQGRQTNQKFQKN